MIKTQDKIKNLIAIIVSILAYGLAIYVVVNKAGSVDINDSTQMGNALKAASLLPTALAVFLAFITKNVILSLGAGMLLGALMFTGMSGNNILTSTSSSSLKLDNRLSILAYALNNPLEPVKINCFGFINGKFFLKKSYLKGLPQ